MRKQAQISEQEKQKILNNKVKPGSTIDTYVIFLLNIFLVIPLWIVVGLPTYIICSIVKLTQPKRRPRKGEYLDVSQPAKDATPLADREYDVIVYGATGFTGKLVAEYLVKAYDSKLKWAIAGRSQAKLQEVRSWMAMVNPQVEELPIIIANSNNEQELKEMVNRTRVLISTVGPFAKYGCKTIALCAAYGTNYIDSTGEVAWVREMIQRYDELAVKTGARIISCCGLDCIPWDLITCEVAQELKNKHKQELASIQCFDEMYQAMSGGTFNSLLASFLDPVQKTKVEFDPLVKVLGKNTKSEYAYKARTQKHLAYSSKIKKFIGMWGLADGNAAIVKRSNALLGYGKSVKYFEAYQYSNFVHGFNDQLRLININACLYIPPLLTILQKIWFPASGQGPSVHEMNQGYLKLRAFGVGTNGQKVKATFTLPDDPGYRDTARMLSEAALALALDSKDIKQGGGFLTPACINNVLMKRLVETGSTIKVE